LNISTCCITLVFILWIVTLPNIIHFKCGIAFVFTQYIHIYVSIMNEFLFIIMESIVPI
jgi:hypothetical protein